MGYNNKNVNDWMDMLRRQRNMLAKQMHIKPENFRWYAAFHGKDHHPHVHVMTWSPKPGEAWLSEKGIEGLKSALACDIFQQDLVQIYEQPGVQGNQERGDHGGTEADDEAETF